MDTFDRTDSLLRPVTPEEFDSFVDLLEMGAGRGPTASARENARGAYPIDRTWGMFDGGRLVGGTASDVLELTVPGGATPAASRPTLAAIAPTSRGRGLATALLAHQLVDFFGRGEHLAVAATSVPGLVDRLGYAAADRAVEIEIELAYVQPTESPQANITLRAISLEEAAGLLPHIFDRHRRGQPGQVARTPAFWTLWWKDLDLYRTSPGPRFFVLAEDENGLAQGYLSYRLATGDLRDAPVAAMIVEDLIAVSAAGGRALWRFCLDFDQARVVRARNVPVDDPLRWLLRDTRGLRVTRTRDFLWLRIVDVDAALAARTYGLDDRLVIEVHDDILRENTGAHALDAGIDGASCSGVSTKADLVMGIADLSAVYLGGTTVNTLVRAGRVEERVAGTARRADEVFASRPAPWTVMDW